MPPLEVRFKQVVKSLDIQVDMPVAIACSGGPDSMALAMLAKGYFRRVTALVVDHGLRKESAREAKQVSAWLKKQGLSHVVLTWKGRKPVRNIQEVARKARYQLLTDYCKQHKISHLLVAHHLEDQAETFLLRLARGSGVDGLSAMSMLTAMYDIALVRPLLGLSKADLLAYLKKHKQAYISDPSNENPVFDRVKIRKLLPTFASVGITPERLAATAANMARARAHLEEETGRFLSTACAILPQGYARLQPLKISEEIALRALATLIMIIGGNEVKTRMSDLERLYAALKDPAFKGATLGGCVFTRQKNVILVYRELRAIVGSVRVRNGKPVVWDNRFKVTCRMASGVYHIGALAQAGWLKLAKTHKLKNPCPNKNILYSLPALRDLRGHILAVPQLGFSTKDAHCEAVFKGIDIS